MTIGAKSLNGRPLDGHVVSVIKEGRNFRVGLALAANDLAERAVRKDESR